jgi:hypothetical protein
MRRAILPWLVALGIAVLAGAGGVVALNATLFGPGAFVSVYLDALARGDVSDALTLPGVDPGGAGAALLQDGTTAGLRDIRQLSDEDRGGVHVITVAWTSPGGSGRTAFEVERIGTRFGLFPQWGFAVSPVARVSLTVHSDARFTVNGVQEVSAKRSDAPVTYDLLVPGSYAFGHTSTYLRAAPRTIVADTVGQTLTAEVQPEADDAFVAAVTTIVHQQLLSCATQTVLFPTGCSFGQAVDNRVSGPAEWTIRSYPVIGIRPGADFGTWAIPATPGTAHLIVPITSLLDGSKSAFDQDVPFQLRALITLGPDDAITVTQQG